MQQTPRHPNQILAESIGDGPWPMTLRWKLDWIETPREWIEALRSWLQVCQREPAGLPARYYEIMPAVESAILAIEGEWAHDLDHGKGEKHFPFVVTRGSGDDPTG